MWFRNFIQALSEYQERRADLYLKHLSWQPMTDEDVEWVNNPAKTPHKS
jgi:hypothetical protein